MTTDNVCEFPQKQHKKHSSDGLLSPRTKEGEYILLLAQLRSKSVRGHKENETLLTLLDQKDVKNRVIVFFPDHIPIFLCQENPRPIIHYSATRFVYQKSHCAEQKMWLCVENHRIKILTGNFAGGILIGERVWDSMEERAPTQFECFISVPFDDE